MFAQNEDLYAQLGILKKKHFLNFAHVEHLNVIYYVEKGNCLNKVSVPCLAQQDASTVLNQLSQLIRNMMNEQVDGIGIGVPSIVDPEKGIVYNVANISSWKEIHLKEILENEFKVAVAINNDSNCFTF